MNFLNYSNKTQSNIIPKKEFDELVQEVFNTISETLSKSLGPLGSSTTILDGQFTSATKDGYAIFKSLRFHNRYKNMIYNLIKAPCTRLNNTVGDGTTTAIVLTNRLFQYYKNSESKIFGTYRLPRQFIQAWDEVINYIVECIKKYAVHLNLDDKKDNSIFDLCYVVSNGNYKISNEIANVYKKCNFPIINIKDSPTNKSFILPIKGFEFPTNLIDQIYAKSEDLSVEESDIYVMIFDYKLDNQVFKNLIFPIYDFCKSVEKKLLILAPYYDALFVNTELKQFMQFEYQKFKSINLILAQYAIGKLEPYQLTDLAVVLQADIINQEMTKTLCDKLLSHDQYDFIKSNTSIGIADYANLSCTNGSIFNNYNIEENIRYQDTLRAAENEYKNKKESLSYERQSYSFEMAKIQSRISQLKMVNYVYYVGSDSELQRNILKDSVDDVIKCVRSAIKSGVVPGCQLSIIKACNEFMNSIFNKYNVDSNPDGLKKITNDEKLQLAICEIIQNAVIAVYYDILEGPDGVGLIKLIPLWNHVKEEGIEELKEKAIEKGKEIIKESLEKNMVFDLENLKFDSSIITSAETDINVLLAASELVKLLISGNQCVFIASDINGSETQDIEINS
jgi:chaperonin GroEL